MDSSRSSPPDFGLNAEVLREISSLQQKLAAAASPSFEHLAAEARELLAKNARVEIDPAARAFMGGGHALGAD